jgi:hypothetical protein
MVTPMLHSGKRNGVRIDPMQRVGCQTRPKAQGEDD